MKGDNDSMTTLDPISSTITLKQSIYAVKELECETFDMLGTF